MKWWELSLDVALILCLAANFVAALHGYVLNMIVVNVVVHHAGTNRTSETRNREDKAP